MREKLVAAALAAVTIHLILWAGMSPVFSVSIVAACLYGALSALKPSAVSSPALSKNDHDPSVDTLVDRNASLRWEVGPRRGRVAPPGRSCQNA
jgi:hypothetical protein